MKQIKPKDRIVTFPWIGKEYSQIIKEFLESLSLNVQLPPQTTKKTIELGVKNSAPMFCFPYKITLGNYIESLENGANTLLMYDSQGQCKLRHYYKVHEFTLRNLGFNDFEMCNLSGKNMVGLLSRLSGKSKLKVVREIFHLYQTIKRHDQKRDVWSLDKPNIGIIGEIFCSIDQVTNYNLERKIKSYGCNPYNTVNLSSFLGESVFGKLNPFKKKSEYQLQAERYVNGRTGGHALQNLASLFKLIDRRVDSVIHIKPLTCFTEDTAITIDSFISKLIKDIKIGDKVLTHKGIFKQVKKVMFRNYEGKILNIDCGGLLNLKVTPEHPLLTLKRKKVICYGKKHIHICRPKNNLYCIERNGNCKLKEGKIDFSVDFVEAKELQKGDFLAIPKPKQITKKDSYECLMVNPKKPKYEDIKEFPYTSELLRVLGYWLAEGSLKYDSNKLTNKKYLSGIVFTFNRKETNFIKEIKTTIEKNFDAYVTTYIHKSRPNAINLNITNRSLAYIFEKLCGKYCDKKVINKEIMNLDPKLQLELVKGFFRGDGYYETNKRTTRYRGTTTSLKLANQLFWILIRNNIKATIRKHKKRENRKDAYTITISGITPLKRLKENLIKLPPRKFTTPHFLETENYFLLPIIKIKKEDFNGKVYNLEVEEDNSYIANLLAVHNCSPEICVEKFIDQICKDSKTPLLKIDVDENSAELNLEMRLETHCELLKMRNTK